MLDMKVTVTAAFILIAGLSADLCAQATLPVPATDTAFHALVRALVKDSLWDSAQRPPQSYFATSSESLNLLRRAGIPVDSISPLRFIGCSGIDVAGVAAGDAVVGYVLTASVGQGIDSTALAVHLTVGCKAKDSNGVRVTGHYCGWDVVRDNSKWRVLRSRQCWKT